MFTESQYTKAMQIIQKHPRKKDILNVASYIKYKKPYSDGRSPLSLSLLYFLKEEKGECEYFSSYLTLSHYVYHYFDSAMFDFIYKEQIQERRKNIVSIIDGDE